MRFISACLIFVALAASEVQARAKRLSTLTDDTIMSLVIVLFLLSLVAVAGVSFIARVFRS